MGGGICATSPRAGRRVTGMQAGKEGVGSYDQELGCWKRPVYIVHTYLPSRYERTFILAVNSSHLPTTATSAYPALGVGIA